LLTLGIPNLNLLFEDDDGAAVCHEFDGKYIIHSEFRKEITKELLKKAMEVSFMIDNAFRERGITELYTWAENDKQHRYNQFLGYFPTGNEVKIDGYDNSIFEYKKDLK
jgi:hypothetical protein